MTPFDGKVVAVNEDLDDEPEAVNEDPYASWIVKLEVEDAATSSLISDEDYQKMMDEMEG